MNYQNVLLIDDDDDDCEIFLAAIAKASSHGSCTILSRATDALQQLEEGVISPDLIFLDLNMPIMNGMQFLAAVKQRINLQNLKIIIFSTSSHPDIIREAKEAGAEDFITKPSDFNAIVRLFQSIL